MRSRGDVASAAAAAAVTMALLVAPGGALAAEDTAQEGQPAAMEVQKRERPGQPLRGTEMYPTLRTASWASPTCRRNRNAESGAGRCRSWHRR